MKRTSIAMIALSLLLLVLLTGCCLSHEWEEATCTAPQTCAKCGKTEGEPLPHTWEDATCTAPKTCSVCGETEGDTLPHEWEEATCSAPKTCAVCGETEGEALGHEAGDWKVKSEPTETAEGEYIRVCDRCGETIESKPYRLPPEDVTVMTTSGLSMSEEEYHQHLLRYLSEEYSIADSAFTSQLLKNGNELLNIIWSEGNSGYDDTLTFMGSWEEINRLLETIIKSIDPDADSESALERWAYAKNLGTGEATGMTLHTGMAIVYNGSEGYQLMFCTLQFYSENVRF